MVPVGVRSSTFLVLSIAAASFAGCLGAEDTDQNDADDVGATRDVAALLAADLATLPCEKAYSYGETSPIFRDIFSNVTEDVGYAEMDAYDAGALVAFARYGGGGFDLWNVTDPYLPEHVAAFPIPSDTSFTLDLKFSSDGKTIFSGGFGAVTIVDIQDPYHPDITRTVPYPEAFSATGAQAHMVHVASIGGEDYLFAATQWQEGVLIYRVVGEPGDIDLEFLTLYVPSVGSPLAAHDMIVYQDPIEEKPILWIANGFEGFMAADVSDPAMPVPVSFGPQYDPYQGYTHTISVVDYGDQRIAVTMAEIGLMAVKVYDVTNMAAPLLLATWQIEQLPTSTQHNTQILGDYMWLGHYGEGVLFFDLKGELDDLTLPAYNLGVLPIDGVEPYGQYIPDTGGAWESIAVDGVMWTSAGPGIHATLNGCLAAGDARADAHV